MVKDVPTSDRGPAAIGAEPRSSVARLLTGRRGSPPAAPAPVVHDDDPETAARLRIAVARLARRLKPTAAAGSLTTTEVDVLATVARCGPIKLSELATMAGLNPTMLSRVVAKLEDLELLGRLGDDTDRRVARAAVTPAGRELHDRIRSERMDLLSRQLELLDSAERRAVNAAIPALEKLAERLLDATPGKVRH